MFQYDERSLPAGRPRDRRSVMQVVGELGLLASERRRIPDARTHRRRRRVPATQRAQLFFQNPNSDSAFLRLETFQLAFGSKTNWCLGAQSPSTRPSRSVCTQRRRSARVSGSMGNCAGTAPRTESTESVSPATLAAVWVTLPVSLSQGLVPRCTKIIVGRRTQNLGVARFCGATGYRKIVAKNAMKNGNRCRTKVVRSTCI
jgi:hypothetical protein